MFGLVVCALPSGSGSGVQFILQILFGDLLDIRILGERVPVEAARAEGSPVKGPSLSFSRIFQASG